MFWMDFMMVFAIALLVAGAFGIGGRRYSVGFDLLVFFLMVFLATWALGVLFRPIGPMLAGAHWVPYLLVALFIALLLTAVLAVPSRRPPPTRAELREVVEEEAAAARTVGVFFWFFLFAAVTVIAAGYLL